MTASATSTLDIHCNASLPLFQSLLLYLSLISIYLPRLRHQNRQQTLRPNPTETATETTAAETAAMERTSYCCCWPLPGTVLQAPWWIYLIIAIVDVGGNYLAVLSLRYTSLTNSSLLSNFSIPSVMFTSCCLLGRTFRIRHYLAVLICLLATFLLFITDLQAKKEEEDTTNINNNTTTENLIIITKDNNSAVPHFPMAYLGDIFAILSAIIYGLGDSLAEYFIKRFDRTEYLAMIGTFGALITSIQSLCVGEEEWTDVLDILFLRNSNNRDDDHHHDRIERRTWFLVCMAWFLLSILYFYITSCILLLKSDATILNLSLLTSTMWATIFSVLVQGFIPSLSFYVSLVGVMTGVILYETAPRNNV